MRRILILLILISASLKAENVFVKGRVTDGNGAPLAGVVVMLENVKSVGTVTDAQGRYSIAVSDPEARLVFSCIGYREQKLEVGTRTQVNVIMEEEAEEIEEVVVVGYGSMRRSDLTGAVSSIKIDEDNASKSTTLDQMLEGRAAGMQVISNSGAPDAGVTIRIRGISTFTGNTDPLYVVDGVIVNGGSESLSTIGDSSVEETNGLAGINPQDIASIEVLKDASATAIYGSQGSNGVILITTKQADRDRPQVNFNAGTSVHRRMHKLDVLGFNDYVSYLERLNTVGAQRTLSEIYRDPSLHEGLKVYPVDWQDYVMRTSISQRYYLSVSGKPDKYNYMFSLGYNHSEGILKTSSADNLTMRLNLQKELFRKCIIGMKSSFGYTYSNIVSGANSTTLNASSGLLRSMLRARPFVYEDVNDDMADDHDDPELIYGPNRWLKQNKNTSERFRLNPSLYIQWDVKPWLYVKSTFGGEYEVQDRIKTIGARLAPTDGNMVGIGKSSRTWYNWDNIVMFKKRVGKFNGSFTVGESSSGAQYSVQNIRGRNLPQLRALEKDINSALPQYSSFSYGESAWTKMSFFGRAILNYADRYVLTLTHRIDGSSKFQGSNKWSQFPSFAFAWRIAEEPWFNFPAVSNAKLRIGWGQVGSQGIDSYQTRTTFGTGSVGNHYSISGSERAVETTNISNPKLKWETSEQVNAGLDVSLFKGRLTFTVDAYRKDSKDLLQNKYIALSTGFTTIAINDGGIRNEGLELTIDSVPVKFGSFEWSLGGNISFNRNTITSVGESGDSAELYLDRGKKRRVRYFNGSTLQNSGNMNPINIFVEGQPMGQFFGYVVDGIVQEGETGPGFAEGETRGPGYIKYADLNGNGYIDEGDKTIIGNPLPDFTYGFSTSFKWKRLTLKAVFNGLYGAELFNLNNTQEFDVFQSSHNVRKRAVDGAWTPQNKSDKWPAIGCIDGTEDGIFSTRTVEDASYLRLSDLSLSWSVPINRQKIKLVKAIDLSLSCSNVFILTRYSGWSPTNNSFGSNLKRMGIDDATAPIPRSLNFDIKMVF